MSNLAATVLDLTGVDGGGQIPGVTLRSTWAGSDSDQTAFAELGKGRRIPMHYPNARFDLFSVFDGEFHYIVRGNGRGEELFDLSTDPGESRNLAEVPGFATILARVRERLRVHLPPGERSTLIAPRSR
jgi:arylsulfatase A-like enzyme